MATLLEIVQDLCGRQNIPVPTTVIGTTDPQVRQMQRLLEEIGNDTASRGSWEGLTNEATLTTTATQSQGAIATIASNGFRYIKNQTIWSRTRRLPVCGPMDAQDWQAAQALVMTGPPYRYRIRGGNLLVTPTPAASESWYFEYMSKNWIQATGSGAFKRRFTVDTDVVLLPEDITLQGLRWVWKKEKGFDYAEDFRMFEIQVKDALGRDGGKPTLSMDGCGYGPVPGIWISPYNSVPP